MAFTNKRRGRYPGPPSWPQGFMASRFGGRSSWDDGTFFDRPMDRWALDDPYRGSMMEKRMPFDDWYADGPPMERPARARVTQDDLRLKLRRQRDQFMDRPMDRWAFDDMFMERRRLYDVRPYDRPYRVPGPGPLMGGPMGGPMGPWGFDGPPQGPFMGNGGPNNARNFNGNHGVSVIYCNISQNSCE